MKKNYSFFKDTLALIGGVLLFMWGVSVAEAYPRASFGRGIWQLVKGACLVGIAVAVFKEFSDAVKLREEVELLQRDASRWRKFASLLNRELNPKMDTIVELGLCKVCQEPIIMGAKIDVDEKGDKIHARCHPENHGEDRRAIL